MRELLLLLWFVVVPYAIFALRPREDYGRRRK